MDVSLGESLCRLVLVSFVMLESCGLPSSLFGRVYVAVECLREAVDIFLKGLDAEIIVSFLSALFC